jgi:hypothetical protein
MADYNDLPGKLERAFQKILQDDANVTLADTAIFKGHDARNVVRPRVACVAGTEWPDVSGEASTGIHRGTMQIIVETLGLTPEGDGDTVQRGLVPKIQDSVTRSGIEALLNAAAVTLGFELTVLEVINGMPGHGISADEQAFMDVLNLQVIAAGAVI